MASIAVGIGLLPQPSAGFDTQWAYIVRGLYAIMACPNGSPYALYMGVSTVVYNIVTVCTKLHRKRFHPFSLVPADRPIERRSRCTVADEGATVTVHAQLEGYLSAHLAPLAEVCFRVL